MKTVVLQAEAPDTLSRVVHEVSSGSVVAFPTDTVYGVGCDVWAEEAIERLYAVKERPHELAIPVLVSSVGGLTSVASVEDSRVELYALMEAFWPGALTLVLPALAGLPPVLLGGRRTVAVRMPDSAFARELIERVGGAMAVTSANISGKPSPANAAGALANLDGRVPILVDGGPCKVGIASTILDLTGAVPVVLRQGGLEYQRLKRVLPDLA